jgi:hypothetical protein
MNVMVLIINTERTLYKKWKEELCCIKKLNFLKVKRDLA